MSTVPEQHNEQTDPGLKNIVFEFDQAMRQDPPGLQGMPGTVPEVSKDVTDVWTDPRRLSIPVQLQPGHDYVIALNTITRSNIRGANDLPAEPYVLSFRTKGGNDVKRLNRNRNAAAFSELRTAVDKNYSHRDVQHVDWPKRFSSFEERLMSSRNGDEFAIWLTELFAPAKDGHLWIRRYDRFWPTFDQKYVPNYNTETIQRLVPGWKKINNFVETGRFKDGIRYLGVTTLEYHNIPDTLNSFGFGWKVFGNDSMILDLRQNGGGSDPIAQAIVSCFVNQPRVFAKTVFPDKTTSTGFTPPQLRLIKPAVFAPRQTGRVAVLIGPRNVSSAESFICMMRQVEGARIFGQPTRGSTGNPQPIELSNGVEVYLPSWVMMDADGKRVQATGLKPDVLIETNAEDFADGDPVLEAALKWLRSD